jgi:signal transduction histidine kinase
VVVAMVAIMVAVSGIGAHMTLAAAAVLIVGLAVLCVRLRQHAALRLAFLKRRQNTFDGAPVALWEEDFSAVAAWVRGLPESASPADLRPLLEANPDLLDYGISLIRVLSVNPMAADMIDMEGGKSLFGGDPDDPITAEVRSRVIEQLVTIAQGQTSLQVPISGGTRSGQRIDAILYWQAARGPDGEADYSKVVVAIADISERVTAERRLQRVLESKDHLVASISHELRTPLTSILGYAELLRDSPPLPPAEQTEMLNLVVESAQDMTFIVEDLLTAARSEKSKLTVSEVPFAVAPEVQKVVAQVCPADAGHIHVTVGSSKALADPERFRQILRNLLVNARRYGGLPICITADDDGPVVRLRVMDSGAGVAPEDEHRIFEAFERAQNAPQRTGSVGLGLGISRHLARLMGGDLTYLRRGITTIFELTLPKVEGDRHSRTPQVPLTRVALTTDAR